ncbi:BrnA antitoxin of type II toxin-antitoxin system [Yoonia maritima]|uniref:BrnA antitoxin of type II toxin-antitoxin system n=1 Tax=Yoonia maritima TaxID=1435347 RepID=A0A2T0W2X9_9RHOB|nr:BrnA antitoxin family protein [Yoonia maritima]PRY79542.1 BrnA antitoxin of type II toxin-antitoxin system [Yoonia maritima]
MIDPKKMTKTQRINWSYAVDAQAMIEWDLHTFVAKEKMLPPRWDEIWKDDDRRDPKRQRVTMRLDADVVKFFKAMGEGYQPRINRVLRMFMHYRLAGIIDGPDTTDYVLRPETLLSGNPPRPKWRDFERLQEEIGAGRED